MREYCATGTRATHSPSSTVQILSAFSPRMKASIASARTNDGAGCITSTVAVVSSNVTKSVTETVTASVHELFASSTAASMSTVPTNDRLSVRTWATPTALKWKLSPPASATLLLYAVQL